MSWIHIDDLIEQFIFLVNNDCTQTAFNGTAPNPVQNSEFTELICEVLNRPGVLTAPAALLKLALGEQSTILLSSQRAFPKNFMDCGFKFRFDNLIDALLDLLKYHVNGEVFLKNSLWIDKSPSETFKFFSDERNLEKITPQHMGLKVLGKSTPRIQDGTLIDYKLSLHGIPLKCQTLINSYIPDEVFVDEQLRGPFTKWHHTHKFRALNSGTLMTDEVIYKIPFGWPGRIFAGGYAESDVKKVFDYRNSTITELV
jgi:ligand-binding SRPBCC domain-containing protein